MSSQPDDVIITKGTIDAQGNQSYTTTTPVQNPDKRTKKQINADQRAQYLAKIGVYQKFLDENPDMADLVRRAMKDFKNNGVGWSDERFQAEYSQTEFAKKRTQAEEQYDIGIGGPDADSYQKKVADAVLSVKQSAQRIGMPLSDEEAQALALKSVRSNLSQAAMDTMWADRYTALTSTTDAERIAGKDITGTAGQIQSELQDTARKFGLKIDQTTLQKKTAEGLGQGERWQEWLQGQGDYFRDQAKLMYPNAAALLDSGKTLADIASGYFSEAAELLGKSSDEMDLTNPMWTGFLNGEGGKILSKDEWVRVIKTDPKYGYDKTQNARNEAASLTDQLFAAFGMA
jgi:hypothetical protein